MYHAAPNSLRRPRIQININPGRRMPIPTLKTSDISGSKCGTSPCRSPGAVIDSALASIVSLPNRSPELRMVILKGVDQYLSANIDIPF